MPPKLIMTKSARVHFERGYFDQFANSEALFPPADLAKTISAEYEAQRKLLCYAPYPSWQEVQSRFAAVQDLL